MENKQMSVYGVSGLKRGIFRGVVVENRVLCTDHYRLVVAVEGFPGSEPGQFVQVDCDGESEIEGGEVREFEWPAGGKGAGVKDTDFLGMRAYLRRPFSIARQAEVGGVTVIELLHRVVGKGTGALAGLKAGDGVSVIGPLGKGFRIEEGMEHACLVGGGVGIPPMFYLAERLAREGFKNVTGFVGAQRRDLLPVTFAEEGVGEFCKFGFGSVVTTDDGSFGGKGFVTVALERFLKERASLKGVVVFCCGPTVMMKATAKVAEGFGVECQVSLEQPMACGMGTCQSCVVRYRPRGTEGEWKYKLTCTDGPVFDSRDLVW